MRRIQLLFVLNGISVAAFGPFATVILDERGLGAAEIGLLTALTAVAFVASVSVWGHLGDVVLGRVRTLQVAVIGAGVLLGTFMAPIPILLAAAAFIGYAAFGGVVGPLSDALAVNALEDPGRQYGRVRAHASAGFMVAAVVLGVVYGRTGYWPVPIVYLVVAVAIAAVARSIPDVGRATLAAHRRGGAIREVLELQPRLRGLLVAVGLAHIGVFAGFTFLSLRIVVLGGGAPEVALSSAVAAGAEIGAMVVAGWLVSRIGLRALFAGSSLLYVVALGLWAVLASPEAIIASRLISGAGYSGMWIASVMAVRTLLPPHFQGSGQALISMVTAGLAAFLANALGGVVFALAGPDTLFLACSALSALAAAAAWRAFPSRERGMTTTAAGA